MRLEFDKRQFKVFLSRRNLLTLLAKLDGYPEDSRATINYSVPPWTLSVTAEEDEPHYANPERDTPRAGAVHPETEARLR